ncbi:MAG: DsbA family oxidoreductase [Candidatus Binatus sp.]|uniref:DsbA family oxidoreductase n=1 Tax=Candidatus Binatus sp. TaxID=2811406 RepID=UPI00271CBE31|nr:DsbA family oxidoreductase [Candidatus Binatus sp.]MDO8431360.1 DsbA family oxidoreductase [Candidatus Binatus sp.]
MAFKIVMFSDFICPFCYIGFDVIEKLKPEFDLQIEWRGFQIHPEWPAEGASAAQASRLGNADARKAAWERISTMAESVGLAMKPPSVLTNSRLALAAAEFARDSGADHEAFEERVYRAYFTEDANIGDREVVLRLAAEAGLDAAQVADAIKSPKYELRLKNNALTANQRGVSGVPTFFIGDYPLVGAQSPDVMRSILKRAKERFGGVETAQAAEDQSCELKTKSL